MTADSFRRAAVALERTIESAHMDHPDFRVGGRIFATLGYPDESCGMVKLPVDEQRRIVEAMPEAFAPVPGKWGEGGATRVLLLKAEASAVGHALELAWQHAQTTTAAKKRPAAKRARPRSG